MPGCGGCASNRPAGAGCARSESRWWGGRRSSPSTSPARWARRWIRFASIRPSPGVGFCPCCAFPRWRASSPARRWASASTGRATRWPTRFTVSPPFTIRRAGVDASPEAVAFAVRFLAHMVWLDVLFGNAAEKRSSRQRADIDRSLEPGVDLAVMLTAAARTARSLVWPADVPETGDLADAFRGAPRRARRSGPRFTACPDIRPRSASPSWRPRRRRDRALGRWSYGMIHGPCRSANP